MALEKRYESPNINRMYWLADALIHLRTYDWKLVEKVAEQLPDDDIAAFCRVIAALNSTKLD